MGELMHLNEISEYVKQRINECFLTDKLIMSKENITNHIIFEIYYDAYIKSCPSLTLRDFALKNSFEEGFDAFYKKVQRDYQAFRENKDNVYMEIFRICGTSILQSNYVKCRPLHSAI